MEAKVHRVLAWTGPAMLVIWGGAFLLLARFIPPSNPAATAGQIVHLYGHHTIAIKIGMVLGMAGSALLVPWAVAISGQLKRIKGAKALADTQALSCALLSVEFITPIAVWMAVSYSFKTSPAPVTAAVHDLGWILFVTVIWSLWVQLVCIAAAIFIDRSPEPVLPRWLGYVNAWTAVLIMPAGLVLFFHSGPFTWRGAIGFFVPLTGFAIWIVSTTYCVITALNKQIAEGSEPG